MPQDEDAFTFDGETGFIDLGPLMRELSLLAMPIQPICSPTARDFACNAVKI